ncbi:serine-rich adhesin for platelets [Episyrphus balteatus]|uniref:serine-rich adhesin for platelets n=1 Tax=Episyrphus balteatus TaxID=286459 RepID=UPI0024853D09|nr:serine-rich adhesin for platelets [Episyrphus balteatus]
MANENEEILQNNNETESNEQQTTTTTTTIADKLRNTSSLGGNNGSNPSQSVATTNGDATDNNSKHSKITSAGVGAGLGDYKNIRATTTSAIHSETHTTQQPVRREENPFSFKHFLNREPTSSCSGTSSTFVINSTTLGSDSAANNNETSSTTTTFQTSTGARPKVPQSSSSSLIGNSAASASGNGNVSTGGVPSESSKMKRSPRFSSFDSQASLAEYAATGSGVLGCGGVSGSSSSAGINTRSSPSFRISQNIDDDVSSNVPKEDLPGDSDRQQFVPRRSYSNYDIEFHPSPRRRVPEAARPAARGFPKPTINHSSANNPNPRPPNSEFAAAAALPDFVQDHWMDAWYCNEMNLNSPPNSPNSPIDFVEDITGGAASSAAGGGSNSGQVADTKCQTLPDFLSDGPIIHSSQRLADVAAGLPAAANWSNMDSPEDDSPSLQLSRLRLENERLCIELNETRQALGEQTRRTNELERSLEQTRSMESAYNRTMAQNIGLVEENLDQSKKRTIAAQNQVAKLNLQVKQLTAEVNALRRENESLRDGDGAVGGSSSNEQRPTAASSSSRIRPSRSQQISRELHRAAATAESNLRQLLAGVDNLRQLAADIENSDSRFDYDDSSTFPPMSDDFLEGCDDYDEYTGGPAL